MSGFPIIPTALGALAARQAPPLACAPVTYTVALLPGLLRPLVHCHADWVTGTPAGRYPFPIDAPIEGAYPGCSVTACNTDRHVLVVDNATCTLYEAWRCQAPSDAASKHALQEDEHALQEDNHALQEDKRQQNCFPAVTH
eukprot:GHRQ01022818.1.p1 GENE.GHRQ01022818.1~~GHRQ01022818.1.p1  ORF type:complete len:141 (+),score=17.51 GHRQ01022818.1:317-739(+)